MAFGFEVVTIGGWYENADGTVSEYLWVTGALRLGRTVASWDDVPSREYDLAEIERADAEWYARFNAAIDGGAP
jgi:hypothetical protein